MDMTCRQRGVRYLDICRIGLARVFAFAAILACAASPSLAASLTATSARIAGDDARTRIVLDFDQKPDFSVHYLANPDRIIVNINAETSFTFSDKDLQPRGLFTDIRYGAMSAGKARIVLTAAKPAELKIAEARESEDGTGWRLVLDSAITSQDKYDELTRRFAWSEGKQQSTVFSLSPVRPGADGKFIVAVDAGHGGIDTGAVSNVFKKPAVEKDITLDFALALGKALNEKPDVEAYLTRDKDVFLSLSERVQLARNRGANLFISLHADTLRQNDIRGATVYTISDRASDNLAAELAQRENKSDEIAGVKFDTQMPEVSDILIDLTRRETQAFSISLANSVVSSFEGQIGLINNPHRSAGFMVLQAPDVPSVLLELGFLSNKDDVKALTDPDFRDRLVSLIADAVTKYRHKLGG